MVGSAKESHRRTMVAGGEEGGGEPRGRGTGAARGRGWRELEEGGGGWFKQCGGSGPS